MVRLVGRAVLVGKFPLPVNKQRFEIVVRVAAFVGVQRRVPLQNIDEFVLPGVGVAKGRHRPRLKPREVDTEIGKAK